MLDDNRRNDHGGSLLGAIAAGVFTVAVVRLLVQNWRVTLLAAAGAAVLFFGLAGIGYVWEATGLRDRWFWPIVLLALAPGMVWRMRVGRIRRANQRAARARHAERMRRIRLGLPEE